VGVARGDDDCCAAVKQALRGGRADAARAARNQGALADELFCEVKLIFGLGVFPSFLGYERASA
jgi:hypothetical protein